MVKVKRTLGNRVHVTRGYGKNHYKPPITNIDYRGENIKVEIRKFDRKFDKVYTADNFKYQYMKFAKWRDIKVLKYYDSTTIDVDLDEFGIDKVDIKGAIPVGDTNIDKIIKSIRDSRKPTAEFSFKCTETGNYVVEILYFDVAYDENQCDATIHLKTNNGKYVKQRTNGTFVGDDNNLNRQSQYFTFKKGNTYTIRYNTNINMGIIGAIVKKYDTYYGTMDNQGDLTIDEYNIKINEKIQPNEATVKLWYNHELDDDTNLSGYLFDFRDEINIYKKDIRDTEFIQIFGGYISTVDVDDKNLIMTLSCADRLIDGDNRYCMQEMVILGGDSDEKGFDYSEDSYQSYDSRGEMLNYLTNIYEVPLGNDNILQDSFLQREFGHQYWYTFSNQPNVVAKNMDISFTDEYLICRNGQDRDNNANSYDNKGNKPQSLCILDVSKTKKNILLNDNPNFWIRYGLGDAEKNVTNVQSVINVNSDISYISNKVRKFADSVTGQKGEGAVKPIWKAVAKLPYRRGSGFLWSPEQVINHGGNCCSKARLCGEMLTYKGVGGIQYVHIKNGGKLGHVFLRLKKYNGKTNFIIDPTERTEKKGWGNYLHYNGANIKSHLKKITDFPDRPL